MNIENIEEVRELYFDKDYVRSRDCLFARVDLPGNLREYIEVSPDGSAAIAASVTTIEKKTLPLSDYIIKWMIDHHVNHKWLLRQSADYGTFLHVIYDELLRGKVIDTKHDALIDKMRVFYNTHKESGFRFEDGLLWYLAMDRNLEIEILSFLRWIEDYDVRPIAIEYKLMSKKEIGYWCLKHKKIGPGIDCSENFCCADCEYKLSIRQSAGCLDLGVIAKGEKTGGAERKLLVDIKSGLTSATYEEYEIQLEGYNEMWSEQNPDCLFDGLFVFKPHIFNSKSRTKYYTFDELTGKQNPRRWPNLCENFNMSPKNFKFGPMKKIISGEYGIGSDISDEAIYEERDEILEKILEMRKNIKSSEF